MVSETLRDGGGMAGFRVVGWGLVLLVLPGVGWAQTPPAPAEKPALSRDAALIETFEDLCTRELPNFEHVEAVMVARQLQLQISQAGLNRQGEEVKHKIWSGELPSGRFALILDQLTHAKAVTTACAIVGGVPDVDQFRADFIQTLHLAPAPKPLVEGGLRVFAWTRAAEPGVTMSLKDESPAKKAGILMQLSAVQKVAGGR